MAARIPAFLADISHWMSAHHLNSTLTRPSSFPSRENISFLWPHYDYNLRDVPGLQCKESGCDSGWQLSFTANLPVTTRSCRLALHNIRKICSVLARTAQVLSCPSSGYGLFCSHAELVKKRRSVKALGCASRPRRCLLVSRIDTQGFNVSAT